MNHSRALHPHVLLLEDNRYTAEPMLSWLREEEGFRVDWARTGEEAEDLLTRYRHDIAVLDIMIERSAVQGDEVLRFIRATPGLRHTRVIMCSALREADTQISHFQEGAQVFLPKPVEPAILAANVWAMAHARTEDHVLETTRQALGALAHGLRTPLGVTLGFLDLARDQVAGTPAAETIQHAHGAARDLQGVVARVVTYLGLIRGHVRPQRQPGSLTPLLDAVIEAEAAAAPCPIRRHGAASLDYNGDDSLVSQALTCLIENAVRHSESRPIDVALWQEGGMARLAITNQAPLPEGTGQDVQGAGAFVDLEHHSGGIGIGLPLSLAIAQAMGGSLALASAPAEPLASLPEDVAAEGPWTQVLLSLPA